VAGWEVSFTQTRECMSPAAARHLNWTASIWQP